MYKFLCYPLLGLAWLSAPTAQAFVVSSFGADADSYIQSHTPTSNFGSLSQSLLKNTGSGNFLRKSYLRFDFSSLTSEPIVGATLTLQFLETNVGTTFGGNANFELYGLTNDALDGWLENTVTWNNAPANNTGNNDFIGADTTLLDTFSLVGKGVGTTVSLNSAGLVAFLANNLASGNSIATFLLRRTTGDATGNYAHGFATRNNSNASLRPDLTITQQDPTPPAPAPGVVILMLTGLLGLAWNKHRSSSPRFRSGLAG